MVGSRAARSHDDENIGAIDIVYLGHYTEELNVSH
jgi:hypothetical protein